MISLLIAAYFLIGILWAWCVDRAQMKEEVPYGSFPSIAPLKQLRITIAFLMIFVGPIAIVRYGPKSLLRALHERSQAKA